MLTLTARIRQTPPDHTGGHSLASDELTAQADTYELALGQLERAVPDGWQIIALLADR